MQRHTGLFIYARKNMKSAMNNIIPGSTPSIAWADALRGFSLLAIMLANVPYTPNLEPSAQRWSLGSAAFDQLLRFLFAMWIDKKFIGIFSMLFGFGIYQQMRRASDMGVAYRPYLFRRMIILLAVGCLHAYLLWFGDIIRYYALGGITLLLVAHWRPTSILKLGVGITLMAAVMFILVDLLQLTYNYDPSIVNELGMTPSYFRYLDINFTIDPFVNFVHDSLRTLFFTTGCIFIGFAFAKMGWLQQPRQTKHFTVFLITSACIGLTSSYLFWLVSNGSLELTPALLWLPFLIVTGFVLQSLFYVAVFTKAYETRLKTILSVFSSVGKMSMSAYVLQSIFYILIFYHWSHSCQLYGKLTLTETYLIVCLLFAVEVALCQWWLKRFETGPLEYLWKGIANRINQKYYTISSRKI
jgi:uncharacterized protein